MDLWPRVDALVERAASVRDLQHHRLHLYAAWRWRSLGRPVTGELAALERGAAAVRLALPVVVRRVREAVDGPMVLLKGADVAALYPRSDLRPAWDIDLLVADAEGVHRALREHGFVEEGEALPAGHHHLTGLTWPGLPVCVEIHSGPNWPVWLDPPAADELLEATSRESAVGHGIRALTPAHQTVVLVAHLWRDDPVRRLGTLLDVMLAARTVEADTLDTVVARYGLEGLWRSTQDAAARVFAEGGDRRSRHGIIVGPAAALRERSLLESRLAEAIAPFYALPRGRAALGAARTVGLWFRPEPDETWGAKLRRSAKTLSKMLSPMSEVSRERERAREAVK